MSFLMNFTKNSVKKLIPEFLTHTNSKEEEK